MKKINIYQAKNGGIYLALGGCYTCLEECQVKKLSINLRNIENFNVLDYHNFYRYHQIRHSCCNYFINKLDRIESVLTEE